MPSPDVSPFVDLTLTDMDAQDVFELALQNLQTNMPEWEPREGNTEVMLMEALAVEVAEGIYAINRVPGAVIEVLLRLYGIERDIGAQPTVDLKFNISGDLGAVIPQGVEVRYDLPSGLDPIIFTTTAELVIAEGATSGTMSVVGDRFTNEGNGLLVGTLGEMIDSVAAVDSVELATEVVNGRNPETDEDYFQRAIQRLHRLSETLLLPQHFISFALEQPYCLRAYGLDAYDPDNDSTGGGPAGNDPGHMTVVVYGDGTTLTVDQKADLLALMQPMAAAMLEIHIMDPTIEAIDVDVTVVADKGWDILSVTTNVEATIRNYLSPATWGWSQTVRRNELIAVIGNAEGVAYVDSLTPAADVALDKVGSLTNVGVLNIEVITT